MTKTKNYAKKLQLRDKNVQKSTQKSSQKSKSFLENRSVQKVKNWKDTSVRAMQKKLNDAVQRQEEVEMEVEMDEKDKAVGSENNNREAENSRRQFKKELTKVMVNSDVIIQVLDARDPENCRNKALEREVVCGNKKLILLLNKVDLIPKDAIIAWMKKLQSEFPTLAFKCKKNGNAAGTNLTSAQHATDGLMGASASVLGADTLLQLLKNYARTTSGSKKAISVGIVGYPNVGKSSVINSLKRSNVVRVGGTAGVTRTMQEVVLDSKVRLIDCPGVVFSGNSEDPGVVLRNAVKVEGLLDPVGVFEKMCQKLSVEELTKHFFTEQQLAGKTLSAGSDFLLLMAQARGLLKRGGVADLVRASRVILQEIASGKFKYYFMPEEESDANTVAKTTVVVNAPGKEFNIDDLEDVVVLNNQGNGEEMEMDE